MQPLVFCCGLSKSNNAEKSSCFVTVWWHISLHNSLSSVLCLFCCETDIISKQNLETEIPGRWELGEGLFFCLSLLSGCRGTICFCPSFLLRTSNIFHLEWSFPQKGEKFTLSFPPFYFLHFAHCFSPFQFLNKFPFEFYNLSLLFPNLPIMYHINEYLWVTKCNGELQTARFIPFLIFYL